MKNCVWDKKKKKEWEREAKHQKIGMIDPNCACFRIPFRLFQLQLQYSLEIKWALGDRGNWTLLILKVDGCSSSYNFFFYWYFPSRSVPIGSNLFLLCLQFAMNTTLNSTLFLPNADKFVCGILPKLPTKTVTYYHFCL